MRRAGPGAVAVVAAACAIVVAGCGGDEGGTATIQYLGPLDPGGTNVAAAKECSDQSNGRYRVTMSPVANSADATRELFVRRLAAGDRTWTSSTWTPSTRPSSRRRDG